jgi:hypothetical protein
VAAESPKPDDDGEFGGLDLSALDEPVDEEESGVQPASAYELAQINHVFQTRDYESALKLGERYLKHHADNVAVKECVRECRVILERRLTKVLEPLDRVVVLRLALNDLRAAALDHRAGFLLSRIDGCTTLEDLLDVAAMPRFDALRLISDWVAQGFVTLED